MSIRFSCPACKCVMNAPDHAGGKKAKCPKCSAAVEVPVPKGEILPPSPVTPTPVPQTSAFDFEGQGTSTDFSDSDSPDQYASPRSSPQGSPGTAAILEILPGLFFQTFGIGHMYAGNVGLGLLIMFGYWILAAVNVFLMFAACIGFITYPLCFFGTAIISTLMAADSLRPQSKRKLPSSGLVVIAIGCVLILTCSGIATVVYLNSDSSDSESFVVKSETHIIPRVSGKKQYTKKTKRPPVSRVDPTIAQRVEKYRRILGTGDLQNKINAVKALGQIGTQAAPAVPDITVLLTNTNESLRAEAVSTLGKIGPAAKESTSSLIKLLVSDDRLQDQVVVALKKIGTPGESDLPVLVKAIKSKSPEVRRYSLEAMEGFEDLPKESVFPAMMDELKEESVPGICQVAARVVGKFNLDASDVTPISSLLQSKTSVAKTHAAEWLGLIGQNAKPAVPELVKLLGDENVELRRAVAEALLRIGPDAMIVSDWLEVTKDNDEEVAGTAFKALASVGSLRKEDTAVILQHLKSPKPKLRGQAAELLGNIKASSKPAIAGLTDLVGDKDKTVRLNAIVSLGKIGPAASESAKALGIQLKDEDLEIKRASIEALGKIGPDAFRATPDLIVCWRDTDLKKEARNSLLKIGENTVPYLVIVLRDLKDTKKRIELIGLLGDMGPAAKEAVPILKKLEAIGFASLRKAARDALLKIQQKK